MTAQNSVNFSKLGTYYRYKLRSLSPLIILTSIFAFLSYPTCYFCALMTAIYDKKLTSMSQTVGIENWSYYDQYSEQIMQQLRGTEEWIAAESQYKIWEALQSVMLVIMIMALACLLFIGFFIILKNFRYFFRKRYVDMDLSLPISEQTRFVGDFLSGLTAYLVPHLVALEIGFGLYYSIISLDKTYSDSNGIALVPQLMLVGLLACVMFYCLTLFVVVCCGRTREASIAPLIINAAIPTVTVLLSYLSLLHTNLDITNTRIFLLPMTATSPAGLLISLLFSADNWIYDAAYSSSVHFAPHLLTSAELWCAIAFTILYAAGAMVLTLARKNERVGEGYVIKPMRHIVSVSVMLSITLAFCCVLFDSYFSSDEGVAIVIAMIIVTFIAYVILELVSGRGFKKFHITLLKYVLTIIASVLLSLIMSLTNGFGIENYIPAASRTESVSFSLYCSTKRTSTAYSHNNLVTDPDIIEDIINIHSQAVNNTADSNNDYYITLSLDYFQKNGYCTDSSVYLTVDQAEELLRAYIGSEDYLRNENYDIVQYEFVDIDSLDSPSATPEEFRAALKADIETLDFDKLYNSANGFGDYVIVSVKYDKNGEELSESIVVYPYLENAYALFNISEDSVTDFAQNTVAMLAKFHPTPIADNTTMWVDSIVNRDSLDSFLVNAEGFSSYRNEELTEKYGEEYTISEDEKVYIMSYDAFDEDEGGVLIDKQSAVFEELKDMCSARTAFYGDDYEYIYCLHIMSTDEDNYDSKLFFIAPEYIDRAAEIFDTYAKAQNAA